MMQNLKVHEKVYHRNGISGIGFYAVEFSYEEDGEEHHAIATVDAYDVENLRDGGKKLNNPGTRVLMLDESGYVDIKRTMRGDHFHKQLCDYIIKEMKDA